MGNKSYKEVVMAAAESGMVLHLDITGAAGQVLLPAGVCLSERHIQLLSANGVESLSIRLSEERMSDPSKSILNPARINTLLNNHFSDNDPKHPLIKELTRICRARMEATLESEP